MYICHLLDRISGFFLNDYIFYRLHIHQAFYSLISTNNKKVTGSQAEDKIKQGIQQAAQTVKQKLESKSF